MHVPTGYNPEYIVDDLTDMAMRLFHAAFKAGYLEEVMAKVLPQLHALLGDADDS